MKIDRSSYGSVLLVYAICIALAVALSLLVKVKLIVWPLLALLLWFCAWQTFFFCVPRRKPEGSSTKIASVVDGRVVIVQKAFEQEYLKRECIQVSVYMNFFDIHSNFWPADGELRYFKYYPGKHMFAYEPKSSELNEHTVAALNVSGKDIVFKQIAGGFARRIAFYGKEGESVKSGEQCGIIKFGSRIDMFLPLDARILVKNGDFVRACETLLAEIN